MTTFVRECPLCEGELILTEFKRIECSKCPWIDLRTIPKKETK